VETLGIINLQEWMQWTILFALLAGGFGLELGYKLRKGTYYRRIE
jgi:hypothetical protein